MKQVSMKKMLMVASVPSMIGLFNIENIRLLLEIGYKVHAACNFQDSSIWPREKTKQFIVQMKGLGIKLHQISFSRTPRDLKGMVQSYWQMDKLVKKEKFQFVHCHTPVAGVVCRIVCKKNHIKVVYTAHGFHFYEGAPLKNWLLYYPVEKWMSRCTDVLITINHEDYRRAKKKFYAKKTVYVPGTGVDIEKFKSGLADKGEKRKELGLEDEDVMLLSVGELNQNKNHATVIRALAGAEHKNLHYIIAGQGEAEERLLKLANRLGVRQQIHLLGYRADVPQLMQAADIFLLPSIREGLNVSLMEAMASGMPCICSDIRGNRDLIKNGIGGYMVDALDVAGWQEAISKVLDMGKGFGSSNAEKIAKGFSHLQVQDMMKKIYMQYVGK